MCYVMFSTRNEWRNNLSQSISKLTDYTVSSSFNGIWYDNFIKSHCSVLFNWWYFRMIWIIIIECDFLLLFSVTDVVIVMWWRYVIVRISSFNILQHHFCNIFLYFFDSLSLPKTDLKLIEPDDVHGCVIQRFPDASNLL